MRRLIAIGGVLATCTAALALAGASDEAQGKRYEVVFDNAFGLVAGGDLKVGGVKAGRTTKAIVEVEVTEPGLEDFRSDASCEIRPQSLIGEYYVDCQPGSSAKPLRGGRVPVERTSSGIPTDLVNNILRRPYRERLRLLLSELGAGLAGRPEDLAEVLRRAHPGLRETNRVLRILGRQNGTIKRFIRDADAIVLELEDRKADVARFVTEAGETAEISATRRDELRAGLRRLPGFLDELRPTMARLGELADEQVPLLTDLQRAAPDLDAFLARLGPFARASRPALGSLGAAAKVGRRAVARGSREVAELRRLANDAPGTAKPLRQLLQSFDDRRRAYANDRRAKASAPPAPDPTAIPEGSQGGFTGLEAIANYFVWQGLSINRFDSISHALVLVGLVNDCVQYQTGPIDDSNRELFERCHQWLGPYQPGVNADDPTETGAASGRRRPERTPAKRIGERRGAGAPEAAPLPGQRDISKPQRVLPPALQDLLRPPKPPRVKLPDAQLPEPAPDDLLDFLLAP
jgi:phospholipid/cholesterol/gamma-HCH transport system substrate-binding protein